MELQDALDTLAELVADNKPLAYPGPHTALELIKAELNSMEHRLGAYERSNNRLKSEMLNVTCNQQGATRAYERIIEGLAKLLQES